MLVGLILLILDSRSSTEYMLLIIIKQLIIKQLLIIKV